MKVLVAGASGFVGGYVVAELLRQGHDVTGLSRHPERSRSGIPMLRGDVAAGMGLRPALEGVEVAYYLVHSFEHTNEEGFARRDRRAAQLFAAAAREANVRRIVYCGVSPASGGAAETAHRRSRAEVASILLAAVPETACLRTWTVLSPRNQFIRFLVHILRRQRLIALPPSSRFRGRPIDARDLAAALVAAATSPQVAGKVVDVAGPTSVDTRELCAGLCAQLGLKRHFLVLPFTPPDVLLRGPIREARLDSTLILSALASARVGDVLPQCNLLPELIGSAHRLEDSLAYAVAAEPS